MKSRTLVDRIPGRHYFRRVMQVLTPQARRRLPWLVGAFFLVSLLDLVGLSLIGPFVALATNPDYITEIPFLAEVRAQLGIESDVNFMAVLGSAIVVLFVTKSLAGYTIHYLIVRFAQNNQKHLRMRLLQAFQALPVEVFVNRSSAGLLNTVIQHSSIFTIKLLIPGLRAFSEMLFLSCLFLYLLYTNPLVTLSLGALFGILGFVYDSIIRRRVRLAGEEMINSARSVNRIITQSVEGFKEIRVAGAETRFQQALGVETQRYANAAKTNDALMQLPRYVIESGVITFVIFLVVAGLMYYGGPTPELLSTLGVFAFAAIRSVNSVYTVLAGASQVRFSEKAVEDLHRDLWDIETEVEQQKQQRALEASSADDEPVAFNETLEVQDVSFRYRGTEKDALSGVSLTIKKGQSIGIIGSSGSGKTTLADILLGLLTPSSGVIKVDGTTIDRRARAWMTHAAYLPQQPFLLDGTVRYNIVLGQRENDIDEQRLERAIELAQLREVIDGLPQQEQTQIGERGIKLSGGQRQRIALARAIYSNRDIIFMDEATAALDHRTEHLVVEAVRRLQGDVTLIIIAHRTSTLRYCDTIFELSDGRLTRSGSYQEIIGAVPA